MSTPTPQTRAALFQRLKEKKEASLGSAGTAIPRLGQASAELSYAQQRLWVLEQMDPGNPRFCVLTAVRLRGGLDLGALAATIREIARRHEILRTRFTGRLTGEDGPPLQVVAPRLSIDLPVVDFSGLAGPLHQPLLSRLLTAEAQRPFDLATGPLVRTFVVRLAPAEHVLVLSQHQIIVDRWSRGLMVKELTGLYAAFAAGRPSPLPEPGLQYADFAAWQRGRLQGETLESLVAAWRTRLQDSPQLDLPVDRPRPAVQRSRGAMRYSMIPRPLLARLQAFSQAAGVTLFMTLLAAFDALLHRWTGQDDVVVGSPIANRNQKQVEELMGFFVNMLALRTRLSPDLSFRELVQRVKETAVNAFLHQDLPFELLVRELDLPRDLSRHPLFQVSLVVQNAPMPPLELPGLEVSLVEVDWGTTAYDLALFFWETALWESLEDGLSLIVSYSTDLYDAPTVARLVGHLERLLAGAMDDPDTRLRDLPLLSDAERHQLVHEWSAGPAAVEEDAPLHARVPDSDAPACERDGESVTYRELRHRAATLARQLRRMGVRAESPVALVLPPSIDLAVAALATLEAGGACLPIDPELPEEHIARLLAANKPAAVIRSLASPLGGGGLLDQEGGVPDARALAYILQTSGTTGAPRTLGLTHGAIACMATADGLLTAADRVALAASPSFDASLWELWAPLLAGACLVVLDRATLLSPQRLRRAIAERRITALFVPTAVLHTLAGEDPGVFAGLRLLLFGGEPADPVAVRAVLAHGRPGRLLHLYGPAEATTYAALGEITDLAPQAAAVPVGRPAAGRSIHLLDAAGSPVPIGVVGEVWIGSSLARGDLGDPASTAERFLPDPFSAAPGARLYRTGDLARHLPDGSLEIRGRADEQVKVRGVRVELAEVRAALTAHPAIREAAVVARGGRLEAFAVPRHPASASAVLAELRGRLPGWLVPARLVWVEAPALPRTTGGKVDFAALESWRRSQDDKDCKDSKDGKDKNGRDWTAVEVTVGEVWESVLGRAVSGVQEDFFALGGQSLEAARAASRAALRFGLDLTVRSLYEAPTLEAFAALCSQKQQIREEAK